MHNQRAKSFNWSGAYELFQIMRDGMPRTRAQLAADTGLARSTIALRIDHLLECGLITPVADAASTGGRPSARVAFNPTARTVAAADIAATHTFVAITDLAGERLAGVRLQRETGDGPETTLASLAGIFAALLEEIGRPSSDLAAVGIGLSGLVECGNDRASMPPHLSNWAGIGEGAKEHFSVPVLVDRDVNVMALGERDLSWPGSQNLIFVRADENISSAIISGGELLRGADGAAGDIGHLALARGGGIACQCGNFGCLEALAGGPAIAAALRAAGADVTTGAEAAAMARSGHPTATQAFRQAGRDIGEILSTCVSIVNPSVIAIGGSLAEAGDPLIAGIRELVYRRSSPLSTRNLAIVRSRTGTEAGVVGASTMAIEYCLSPDGLQSLQSPKDEERNDCDQQRIT